MDEAESQFEDLLGFFKMESLQASASFEGVAKERGEERKGELQREKGRTPPLAVSLPASAFSRGLVHWLLKMNSLLTGYKMAGPPHK